jgi:hypothetical protein
MGRLLNDVGRLEGETILAEIIDVDTRQLPPDVLLKQWRAITRFVSPLQRYATQPVALAAGFSFLSMCSPGCSHRAEREVEGCQRAGIASRSQPVTSWRKTPPALGIRRGRVNFLGGMGSIIRLQPFAA